MKRFVSKIAFEFFCMKNEYCSRNDSEDLIDMIDFICDEKISDKLTIDLCFDKDAYKKMEKLPFGSHFISYSVNDDGILWHISFFGFVIYRLKLGVKPKTIKSKREFVLINFEEENISQDNSILYYFKCGDSMVPAIKEYAYVMMDVLTYLIQNDSSIASMKHDYNVLHEQYGKILNTIYITSRILKNFINDEYKLPKCDKWVLGLGHWTRSNAELCLIGTKGTIHRKSKKVQQVVDTHREEHSKKPAIVRERIVELVGDLPRIELFARQTVDGWDCWGNEV